MPVVKNFAVNLNAASSARPKVSASGYKNRKIEIISKARITCSGSGNGEKPTLVTGAARNLAAKMCYKMSARKMTIKNSRLIPVLLKMCYKIPACHNQLF